MVYQPSIRDILFVEPADEIPAVVDKIRTAQSSEIALIIPYGARVFASPIDMLLLQREASSAHKNITVISSDPTGRAYAQAAGMAVADRIEELAGELIQSGTPTESTEAAKPKMKITDVNPVRGVKPLNVQPVVPLIESPVGEAPTLSQFVPEEDQIEEPERRELKPQQRRSMVHLEDESKLEAAVEGRKGSWARRILLVLTVTAVGVAAAVAYAILPRATIEIVARTEPVSFDVEFTADKAASATNVEGRIVPGQFQEIRKTASREFAATGERDVTERARGIIAVYNSYSSSPQTLVATTRFLSQDSKLFRTVKTVTVPGAKIEEGQIIPSSLDVEVVADAPGAEYNIGPADFTIPGFEGTPKFKAFTGKSKNAMAGGAKGRVKVVTAGDLDGARRALEEGILPAVEEELKQQIASDLVLVEGASSVATAEARSSTPENGIADNFTYTVKVVGQAMVFRSGDLGRILDETLEARLAEGRKARPEKRQVTYAQVRPDFNRGTMLLSARVEEVLLSRISEDDIKRDLAGRTQAEAQQYVDSRPAIDSIQVILWPFWVRSVPDSPAKIQVRVR
ncbi:hypothetical protein HYW67_04430 [Candidatus Parcubacteria bacterium]|nr:hypothetical protein [Candidatus Parcubacteria bacterium]